MNSPQLLSLGVASANLWWIPGLSGTVPRRCPKDICWFPFGGYSQSVPGWKSHEKFGANPMKTSESYSSCLGWCPSSPCADIEVCTAAWWCGDLGAAWKHRATCWHHKGFHFRSANVEIPKGGQVWSEDFDNKPLDTFGKTSFDTLSCPSSYPPYSSTFYPMPEGGTTKPGQSPAALQPHWEQVFAKGFWERWWMSKTDWFFVPFSSHFGSTLFKGYLRSFSKPLGNKPSFNANLIWWNSRNGHPDFQCSRTNKLLDPLENMLNMLSLTCDLHTN